MGNHIVNKCHKCHAVGHFFTVCMKCLNEMRDKHQDEMSRNDFWFEEVKLELIEKGYGN